ncbi:hypothetical protein QWZ13_16955 [Reinekea marina]|uniref:hypothetical protein n=1 Tax=Reinekea marina TaxID=1310421 RepID=UPI0025B5D6AA|nr:hypothetical protein [Reinekea marina]MDN3650596.1 hypothetical protein [Reinekea marina]
MPQRTRRSSQKSTSTYIQQDENGAIRLCSKCGNKTYVLATFIIVNIFWSSTKPSGQQMRK